MMGKTLVIYYSRQDQNYVNGDIVYLEKGNTEVVAGYIAQAADADLFEIETVKDYPADYTACTVEAKRELKASSRPGLRRYLDNIDQYDRIVIAGPCWWGTFPMPVFSLLEWLDFTGKTVYPVMTHEGSGLGGCVSSLMQVCSGAAIGKGLAIHGATASQSRGVCEQWVSNHLLNV